MIEQFHVRDDSPRKYPGLTHWTTTQNKYHFKAGQFKTRSFFV
jgi:hypothetical protein